MITKHQRIARLPYPKSEREWQHTMSVLAEVIGFDWDGSTMVVQDSTEFEGRPSAPVLTIVSRIGDSGTGTDTRLLPVAKTANLGSAIASNPLTAADAGADATITVAAFTAVFDFGSLNVSGATITGLAYSTKFKVYLTDFDYADGSYTAALTTTADTVLTDDPGNFYVGTITTPAAASPPTSGGGGGGHYEP